MKLDGLYTDPKAMDFGSQQRLSFSSLLRTGAAVTSELSVVQPSIAGSDTKLLGRVRQLVQDRDAVVFAVPDRAAREHLKLLFSDESIPFEESLGTALENEPDQTVLTRHSSVVASRLPMHLFPLESLSLQLI